MEVTFCLGIICWARPMFSVQFSDSVMSESLRPQGPQHARPPCPSPTHRVYTNSCPLSQWCHTTTSSSVIPFSSYPQSLQASGYFQMSQLFASGGQSIGVSALMIGVESIIMPKQQALIRTGPGQTGISPTIAMVLSTSYPFYSTLSLYSTLSFSFHLWVS